MQQGKIPFKPQKWSFADICKDILETLNPTANTKIITINYSSPDGINVFADIDVAENGTQKSYIECHKIYK